MSVDVREPLRRLRRRLPGSARRRQIPPASRRKQAARREFLESHATLPGARVLEIGALDEPLLADRAEVTVEYLDWFSGEDLRARHAETARRRADRIIDPTYVVKGKRFAEEIDATFDVVVANHVLEHIADPIAWLAELDRIVAPEGVIFLCIPDRRYTFDYLRPVSTVADLVRAHRADLERPDFTQVLEAIYYHRPLRVADLERGSAPPDKLVRKRFSSLAEAIGVAERESRGYADVHCHVFQSDSFPALIEDLRSANLSPWRVRALQEPERGSNEFRVVLDREG